MTIEILGTGQPDGTSMAKAVTEKISMYGGTAVVQAATIADVTDATGTYNSTILNDLITKFNTLLDDLSDLGITAA
jgi:hypothetical protein